MPYSNIHWIKLEKRLLNDYRFYTMSEKSQLIYIKFLMLSAETHNKMPKNSEILKTCFRSNLSVQELETCIKEIKNNFPKFKEINGFYEFKDWKNRHNPTTKKDIRGISHGNPTLDKDKNKSKNREDKSGNSPKSYFYLTYERVFNTPYVPHEGKDWQVFDDLQKKLPADKIKALIDKFFKCDDDFVKKNGYTVQIFASRINSLQADTKPKTRIPY